MRDSTGNTSSSGLVPKARLVGYAHAGVQPRIMGMGPVPATQKVLDRTGVKLDEIDLFEVNEAFAPRRWRVPGNWICRRSAPTRTAAASPLATRSRLPGPS
jgi:hypothetical protein